MTRFPIAAVVTPCLLVSGCTVSSTVALTPVAPKPVLGRSVIIFSLTLKSSATSSFRIALDEYDLQKQNATGNCLHFERVSAEMPYAPGRRKYFAYLVPAGAYSYSIFNTAELQGPSRAFIVPKNKATYLGDFNYLGTYLVHEHTSGGTVTGDKSFVNVTYDLPQAEKSVGERLVPAKVVEAVQARPFMCTP